MSDALISSKLQEIRTRIAPSPTGYLHIGTARTALFNYLFSKHNNGSFILRIEDTDLERSNQSFEIDILENLKWLGIKWDEGPDIGGKFGPYRQSERIQLYNHYLQKLFNEEKVYYCFCSEEELEAERQYQMSIGQAPKYSGKCRNLSQNQVQQNLAVNKPAIIRFKVGPKIIEFNDIIRGKITFDTDLIGDIAIAKNLNTPLYNFAVVIDDYEMKISHVIRGEDHIPNTPKQIILLEALGFPKPHYAHLPLILGSDRTKLSKRHAVVSVANYRDLGYLSESIVNFMALLGWNPGNDREIYSLPSLVKEFTLENVQKSGAIFNIQKMDWLNGFYIRQKSVEKLTEMCLPFFVSSGLITPLWSQKELMAGLGGPPEVTGYKITETGEPISFEYLKKIVAVEKERIKSFSQISELTDFFFKNKLVFEKSLLRWKNMTDDEVIRSLTELEKTLDSIKESEWTKEKLEKFLLETATIYGDRGALLWPLRVALSGKKASASPFEIADILGKKKSMQRIADAKEQN